VLPPPEGNSIKFVALNHRGFGNVSAGPALRDRKKDNPPTRIRSAGHAAESAALSEHIFPQLIGEPASGYTQDMPTMAMGVLMENDDEQGLMTNDQ